MAFEVVCDLNTFWNVGVLQINAIIQDNRGKKLVPSLKIKLSEENLIHPFSAASLCVTNSFDRL